MPKLIRVYAILVLAVGLVLCSLPACGGNASPTPSTVVPTSTPAATASETAAPPSPTPTTAASPTPTPTSAPPATPAPTSVAGLNLPSGFVAAIFQQGLNNPTSIAYGPDGQLYVSTEAGSIVALVDQNNDGTADNTRTVISGFDSPLGIAFYNNLLYISSRGEISTVQNWDGKSGNPVQKVIVSGLPNGRHQNDGIAFAGDGKMYFGNGSTSDLGAQESPLSAAILRANADGSGLEVFAKGLRNPYDLAFNENGDLFATDNGPDAIPAPDELNWIKQGGDYGFPNVFGQPPAGSPVIGPVLEFEDHAAVTGITFYNGKQFPQGYSGNAFVTEWGSLFGGSAGQKVMRVQLQKSGDNYTGSATEFITGMDHPIDVTVAPDGSLMVADYGNGTIYRVIFTGK
jgi:glucose/arabinose dehydrogenase